jgi:hypothetical protein
LLIEGACFVIDMELEHREVFAEALNSLTISFALIGEQRQVSENYITGTCNKTRDQPLR